LTGKSKGQFKVVFDDGDTYISTNPEILISGLIVGDRILH